MLKEINYPIIVRGKNGEKSEFYTQNDYYNYIKNLVIKEKLKVLREKSTGKALGISYTEEGLKTIANKTGRYVYFTNVTNIKNISLGKKSNKVYVEDFVPRTFSNNQLNKAEIHWLEAAKFKIYNN